MLDGQAGVGAAWWNAVDAAGRNQSGGMSMMVMVVVLLRLLLVLGGYSVGRVNVVGLDLKWIASYWLRVRVGMVADFEWCIGR